MDRWRNGTLYVEKESLAHKLPLWGFTMANSVTCGLVPPYDFHAIAEPRSA